MNLLAWKLFASLAIAATAASTAMDTAAQDASANATKSFDFAQYCNGSSKFDSMMSSPSGTRCFDSKKEFVGVTDWFLTGQYVFSQFRNMWTEPFLCKAKFTSDPTIPTLFGTNEYGEFALESWSGGVRNTWMTIVGDWIGSYAWKDSGVALSNPGPVDYVKFFLYGDVCIKNLMIACNGAASNGLGDVAISVGNGFWENFFGTRGLPWTHCGPDGTGVKLVTPVNLAVYFSPWSFSGDFDRFYRASYMRLEDLPSTISRCFSGEGKSQVAGMTVPFCTTNED